MGRAHFLNNYFRNGVNITFPLYPQTEVKFTNFVVEIIAVNDFKIDTMEGEKRNWKRANSIKTSLDSFVQTKSYLHQFFLYFILEQSSCSHIEAKIK